MPTVIGNIRRAVAPGKTGRPDPGELVVDGDTLEFRGKKGTIRLSGVRAVTREPGSAAVNVAYGSPEGNERFMDYRKGVLKLNAQADVFVAELRSLLGLKASGGDEMSDTAKQALAYDAMRALRRRMAVTAAILVVGTLVTVITYSRAREGGGRYFVAWGAILFGALGFAEAAWRHTKASAMFRAAGGVPGTKPAKEPMPDVAALRGARDVDGLVRALWHDDLQVRVAVMDALAEFRDPRATELLIASLTNPRWDVRWSAAEALGKLGDRRAVEPLKGVMNDDNAMVRAVAEQSLASLEQPAEPPPSAPQPTVGPPAVPPPTPPPPDA
ncbi:MAG: HEAT repeat domain-containing protein [Actinobacteria bacterium]|nr:HEAT repeat domain-containing protein [Actinomycetota bacterium]